MLADEQAMVPSEKGGSLVAADGWQNWKGGREGGKYMLDRNAAMHAFCLSNFMTPK
jgi:hypothetical protein